MGTSLLVAARSASTEIRIDRVQLDPPARAFVEETVREGIRLIAHRPDKRTVEEYDAKERQARGRTTAWTTGEPVIFLEVTQGDASTFSDDLQVRGVRVGRHRLLRCTQPRRPQRDRGPAARTCAT